MKSADLKKRIIELSYKHKLSHLSSCLTAVEIIEDIYRSKQAEDKFVLSAGHAGLALYVVLEKYEGFAAEYLLETSGIHPCRKPFELLPKNPFDCSTGSLGQGITVALGLAMADPDRKVYCLISDGELAEGSVYEACYTASKFNVRNLIIALNFNGYTAYDKRDSIPEFFYKTLVDTSHIYEQFPFLNGLEAHYHVLTEEEYHAAIKLCDA